MSCIINASTSAGLVNQADTSGILQLQTASTTAVTIDSSQNVTLNNVIPSGSTAPTNGMFLPAANSIGLSTASTERMRIDSSGNLLLNSTSNTTFSGASGSPKQYIYGGSLGLTLNNTVDTLTLVNTNANTNYLRFYQFRNAAGTDWTTATTRISQYTDTTLQSYIDFNPVNGTYGMAFGTGNSASERMRIDSGGSLCLGQTSNNISGAGWKQAITFAQYGIGMLTSQSSANMINFYTSSGYAGSITTSTTTTAYNTSSDYRLKDNVQPMIGALDTVAKLKPVTFTWKADNSAGQGFIAHELQAVVSDCVTGEKDAVDAEGKPVYQGIDTSFLVATLTAAIQEQQALITSLTARITALEGAK